MMTALPKDFETYTRSLVGNEAFELLAKALTEEPPVSVRVNPWKWKEEEAKAIDHVPWSHYGRYLDERPRFTFDPLFHAGCYYVQEASSMFVEHVLRTFVTTPCAMLDLCAAPGGKSTLARTVLPEDSLLVSNEIVRTRAQVLAENLIKWGHPATVVTNNAPADFAPLHAFFDIILADVPCSGEGMFRKDPASIDEWSAANVETCRQRQQSIIHDIWDCLKPGGVLIYSTCTYNALENEENVRWIMNTFGAELLDTSNEHSWNIQGDVTGNHLKVNRFFPSHLRGEGFFLAALRKPIGDAPIAEQAFTTHTSEEETTKQKNKRADKRNRKNRPAAPALPTECLAWITEPEQYTWSIESDTLRAFPKEWSSALNLLQENLTLLHAGIETATLKGRDWMPAHPLALSTAYNRKSFPEVEVSPSDALSYLRREGMILPPSAPRGYVLLTYRNIPLGFVKNIGNRANNLYPNEWRIRSSHGECCEWA